MPDYLAIADKALAEYQARKKEQPVPAIKDERPSAMGAATEERPRSTTLPPGVRLADVPPERQAEELRRRLDTLGWCGILARKIGDDAVVILAHDPARVPPQVARRFPVFTPAEVVSLHREGGLEALQRAYEERLLPGRVIGHAPA